MKDKCSADHRNGWSQPGKAAKGVVLMQQSSPKKNSLNKIGASLALALCLASFIPFHLATKKLTKRTALFVSYRFKECAVTAAWF